MANIDRVLLNVSGANTSMMTTVNKMMEPPYDGHMEYRISSSRARIPNIYATFPWRAAGAAPRSGTGSQPCPPQG